MQVLKFREFLEGAGVKTRLAIFDFDGTLVNTPGPEEGKARYQQVTGQPWPHKGWWGRRETLTPPVFNNEEEALKQEVVAEFHKAKADPNTQVVMMTGRHGGQEKEVRAILSKYGLEPDEHYYQGHKSLLGHPLYPKTQDTWDYKNHVLKNILVPRSGIKIIELWDDRVDHVPKWLATCQWIKENYPQINKIIFHDSGTGQRHEV